MFYETQKLNALILFQETTINNIAFICDQSWINQLPE